jgi:hypothetical protein
VAGSPASWTAVEAIYTDSANRLDYMAAIGGQWFASGYRTGNNDFEVYHSSDPRVGAWTRVGLYDGASTTDARRDIIFDGTNYIAPFVTGNPATHHVLYATDPAGSWTAHQMTDITNAFAHPQFTLINGYYCWAGANRPTPTGSIWYSSSLTGTYSHNTDSGVYECKSIHYQGGSYYTLAVPDNTSDNPVIRTASSISGSWSTVTTFTGYRLRPVASIKYLKQQSNGLWTLLVSNPSESEHYVFWTDDLSSSTWDGPHEISADLTTFSLPPYSLTYGGGYWVVVGVSSSGAVVGYATAIDGPYTAASITSSASGRDVVYYDREFALTDNQKIFMMTGGALPEPTTAPRLLRQRQSPKRTPARVRGVDLRQRQTPFI